MKKTSTTSLRQNTSQPGRKKRLLFTGLTMGLADLVPGVSGGTIALLLGIYDELLYSVRLMTGQIPKLILARKFKQAFLMVPFGFLLPLGAGIFVAIFGLVHVISYLLEAHPAMVWALFFGLVLGSSYVIARRIAKWTIQRGLLLCLGFALTYILVGLPSMGGSDAPLAIFGTGALAITAMILPGISGSLIMVLLGQYEIIIHAVAERDYIILVLFAVGAIIGLGIFVRLLTWLLKHYHFAVIAVLVGIMAGSLRRIWPWQNEDSVGNVTNSMPSVDTSLLWAVLLILTGFAIVFFLERAGVAREHDDIGTVDFKKELKTIEGS